MKWKIQKECGNTSDIRVLGDGEEAIEVFQSLVDNGRHEDIVMILMDIHMPRCGGIEAMKALRAIEIFHNIQNPVTIVGFSADISDEMKVINTVSGANYVLEKPPVDGAFESMIHEILTSGRNR